MAVTPLGYITCLARRPSLPNPPYRAQESVRSYGIIGWAIQHNQFYLRSSRLSLSLSIVDQPLSHFCEVYALDKSTCPSLRY